MEERTKYILIGIIIGIVIGIAIFYLLEMFRIIRPLGFGGIRDFARPENVTNFTRTFRG